MSDLRQAEAILGMALKDLKALRGMMDSNVFEEEIFGFHVQQCVEKSLKAWLALVGTEYPHVHDISVLLTSLKSEGIDVEEYWDLVEYNAFAVQFRYESIQDSDEVIDRELAIREAKKIVGHVKELLESRAGRS